MKTKLYWLALIVSAALSAPAQAGNYHGGGGRGNSAGAARGPSAPSFRSMPRGNFGGGRMIYSGQRSSSIVNSTLEISAGAVVSRDSRIREITRTQIRSLMEQAQSGITLSAVIVLCDSKTLAAIISPKTETDKLTARSRIARTAPGASGMETIISEVTGKTMSSHGARPNGIGIGTAGATTGGADTVAISSTAPGSSSTSDFIHGGRPGIRTTTTPTITIRIRTTMIPAITTQALTRAKNITIRTTIIRPINTAPIQPSPMPRNGSRVRAITAEKSTVFSARKPAAPSRVIRVTTACA
jgi:hypothetical protein